MEFSGVVEAEDLLGLFGEIFFGFREESKMGISVEDDFKVGNEIWLGLNRFGSRAFFFLAFFSEFFGNFRDEEGGGESGGGGGENVVWFGRD